MSSKGSERDQSRRRFLSRYGAIILRGGIAAIPAALYRYQGELKLKPQHVWFVSAILAHKWDDDMPCPSLRKMAPRVGISEKYLHTIKGDLERAGWLTVIPRTNTRGGTATNYFDFSPLLGRLEELLKRDKPRPEDDQAHLDDAPDGWEEDDEPTPSSSGGPLNHSSVGSLTYGSEGPLNHSSDHYVEADTQEALLPEANLNSKGRNSNVSNSKYKNAELSTTLRVQSTVDNRRTGNGQAHSVTDQPPAPTGGAASARGTRRQTQARVSDTTESSAGRRAPKAPDQLTVAMEEASQKLNDEQPRSSLTRAVKLWRESGMPVDKFCQRVYQAMAETRQAKVTKTSKFGAGVMNRTPLFFAELERQLGFRDAEDWSVRVVPPGL